MFYSFPRRLRSPLSASFVVGLVAAFAAASLIWSVEEYDLQKTHTTASDVAGNYATLLERNIRHALTATYTLAGLVRQGKGSMPDFDAVAAEMLPLYPGVSELALAPGGIIQHVAPLSGNKGALGLDLLQNAAQKKEALLARDSGKLTLAGPLNLVQGGLGVVGRLPVFLNDPTGKPRFWGFTLVVIPTAEVLRAAGLTGLVKQGYDYELWRIHPTDGTKQTIAASSSVALIKPVNQILPLPNAVWTLSVMPAKGWSDPVVFSLRVALGVLISLLLAYTAKLLVELGEGAQALESLVAQRTSEVQASEARFRSLTEMSSDFYWESDAEHRLITRGSANKKASTVSIFERGTQIGERRWEIPYLSPDEAGWQAHRAMLDAHLPFRNFELSRRGDDGSERFISISGDPVFDAAGAFTGYRGVGTDITERKKGDAMRDQIAAIVENSSDAIYSRTLDGAIVSWNPGAEKMLGYTAPEVIGKSVAMIIPPSRRGLVRDQNNEKILCGETIPARESTRLTKDGRVIDVIVSNSPVRDNTGRIIGVSVILKDITEYRRTQDALRAAEEQFRGLVEQSIAGIYIIQDGKLAYVNPRAAEIVDQGSADEIIGTEPLSWVAEADRGKVVETLRRLLEGEAQSAALDFGVLRRDGKVIQVGANASRATRGGRPAVIGLIQDISERRRADEEIQRYVGQLKTAFMSTVEVATTLSEMRDPYTAGHERRVGKIAAAIGAELGFDDQRIEGLQVAGNLHDIGKIIIPAEILSKPGKLTNIEYRLIQGHPLSSYDVLKDVQFPWPVAQVALQHHERMDGSGYPHGLKGDAILMEARIMAVADVVEAMSSHRPYRPGLGIDKALAEIERGRATAYDADVADACLRLFRTGRYQLPE